ARAGAREPFLELCGRSCSYLRNYIEDSRSNERVRSMKTNIIVGCIIAAASLAAFGAGGAKMKISSPAFQEGGTIPEKFSKNGQNVNPELRIEGAPAEAKSLVLIVDDPDAPV